ncbi:MAG: CbbQ/NirQ/NorQ/GpvN family protein [Nitrospirae bacterium]|nr:CbbQ/NirQ/NorQ/GpvN family protein [Nitrospirota bacterium]MCL5284159.1 CbbQ/NirQ/NorQ/GpvN family protein [Nitrospirota bacterium]
MSNAAGVGAVVSYVVILMLLILGSRSFSGAFRRISYGIFVFITLSIFLLIVGANFHYFSPASAVLGMSYGLSVVAVFLVILSLYFRKQKAVRPSSDFFGARKKEATLQEKGGNAMKMADKRVEEAAQELLDLSPKVTGDDPFSLRTIFEKGFSVLLYGPTGSGKTFSIVIEHLSSLKKEGKIDQIVMIPCSDGMEDYDLLSKPIPIGPQEKMHTMISLSKEYPDIPLSVIAQTLGDWTRVEGPLKRVFRLAREGQKIAVVFDELNRASRAARNLILKAIDPVLEHYELHDFITGDIIAVPLDRIQFCATSNIGASYSQTHDLDESLLDRFQSIVFVDYNTDLEREIFRKQGLPPEIAESIMRVAETLREAYKQGHLSAPLSTRHLKNWGQAILEGADPVASARGLWLNRLISHDQHGYPDEEQLQAIEQVLSGAFGLARESLRKGG